MPRRSFWDKPHWIAIRAKIKAQVESGELSFAEPEFVPYSPPPGWVPPIPESVVFDRDKNTCYYCGKRYDRSFKLNRPRRERFCLDHIVPKSRDGGDNAGNLVTSCVPCNYGKSDRRRKDEAAILKEVSRRNAEIELSDDAIIHLARW